MRLYSRDDTAGQLALQNTLIVQVQQGHRFVTPLHRGSQRPIQEPSVSLERFRKAYPDYHWLFLPFNGASSDPVLEGVPMHQESKTADTKPSQDDDSSDSSSSSTSSASSSVSHQRDMGECEEFEEFVVARITKIQHMMLLTTDSHQPFWENRHFRAACGARLPRDDCIFDTQLDPSLGMCRHTACFKRWQQVSSMAD